MEDIENIDCLSGTMWVADDRYLASIASIDQVTENIYLSGIKPVNAQNILDKQIKLIICCADPDEEILLCHQELLQQLPDIKIVVIPYDDVETQCLADNLPITSNTDLSELHIDACDALTSALNLMTRFKGNILVHCYAGISRSVAVVCYYLMFTKVIPFDEALEIVQKVRPIADPNEGFTEELTSLGQMILMLNR